MTTPTLPALALLPLFLVLCGDLSHADEGCDVNRNPSLRRYVSPEAAVELYKPADWLVRTEAEGSALRVVIAPPAGAEAVELRCAPNESGEVDALRLLVEEHRRWTARHGEVLLSETFATPDRAHAVTTVRYLDGDVRIEGRYYFESTAGWSSVQGYRCAASRLRERRSLLVDILSNLRLGSGAGQGMPEPLPFTLGERRAPDGSLSIRIPADWTFTAGGGRVLTGAKQGGAGFVFTGFEVLPSDPGVPLAPTVLVARYQPPAQFLRTILSRFGNKGIEVVSSEVDVATMQSFVATIGRGCDAADVIARWTSPEGQRCLGAFKLIDAKPSMLGMWFSIVTGCWAPEEDFVRHWPLLEAVGSSFAVDDGYARDYVRKGLARAKELAERTRRSMAELNRSREENQAAWEARQERKDFMNSRWDDYRRGQSYWVSELEGGKVYATDPWGTRDTGTGDYWEGGGHEYLHFEGENPRHPSETMREVSSYELARYGAR